MQPHLSRQSSFTLAVNELALAMVLQDGVFNSQEWLPGVEGSGGTALETVSIFTFTQVA